MNLWVFLFNWINLGFHGYDFKNGTVNAWSFIELGSMVFGFWIWFSGFGFGFGIWIRFLDLDLVFGFGRLDFWFFFYPGLKGIGYC